MVKNTVDTKKFRGLIREDQVLVGFIAGVPHAGSHETVAELAKKLSYGFAAKIHGANESSDTWHTVPARPFLEEGIAAGLEDVQKAVKDHYTRLTDSQGKDRTGLKKVGAIAVGKVIEFVQSDFYKGTVPNAQMTIDIKGSDKPLIDTGQMINSTTYLVKEGVTS